MTPLKTVVSTGASRGIDHATVKRFPNDGWRVLTCSRKGFDHRCPWPGGEENHIHVNLSNPQNTVSTIVKIHKKLDRYLDAFVNNAGVLPKAIDGGQLNTFDTELQTWGPVFHVNFFASVVLARGLKAELAAAKGSVVNIASIAGARFHLFARAAYATSKAALATLTREMVHNF